MHLLLLLDSVLHLEVVENEEFACISQDQNQLLTQSLVGKVLVLKLCNFWDVVGFKVV